MEMMELRLKFSLKLIPDSPIDNKPALVQVMARRRTGGKPLPEPMMSQFTDAYMQHHGEITLRWRQNGRGSVSNHQPHDCLLNRLFRRRSKKTSKLRVTGLCVGNSPGTGEFPTQMASYAENVSIWWRHHELIWDKTTGPFLLTSKAYNPCWYF